MVTDQLRATQRAWRIRLASEEACETLRRCVTSSVSPTDWIKEIATGARPNSTIQAMHDQLRRRTDETHRGAHRNDAKCKKIVFCYFSSLSSLFFARLFRSLRFSRSDRAFRAIPLPRYMYPAEDTCVRPKMYRVSCILATSRAARRRRADVKNDVCRIKA